MQFQLFFFFIFRYLLTLFQHTFKMILLSDIVEPGQLQCISNGIVGKYIIIGSMSLNNIMYYDCDRWSCESVVFVSHLFWWKIQNSIIVHQFWAKIELSWDIFALHYIACAFVLCSLSYKFLFKATIPNDSILKVLCSHFLLFLNLFFCCLFSFLCVIFRL